MKENRYFFPLCLVWGLLFVSTPAFPQDESFYPVFSWKMLYFGPALTYSGRSGYIDVPELKKSIAVDRANLMTGGFDFGIRYPLSKNIRLQLGAMLDMGSCTEDTLNTSNPAISQTQYFHGCLEPQLHWAFMGHSKTVAPYLLCGIGINCVVVQEKTFSLEDPLQEYSFTDRQYYKATDLAFSAGAGLGLDIALSNRFAIFAQDYFRYLYPVSYTIKEDFLLTGKLYTETHYGNVATIGLLFKW